MTSSVASPLTLSLLLLVFSPPSLALLDQGQWDFTLKSDNTFIVVSKAMYAGSNVTMQVACPEVPRDSARVMAIDYVLRRDPCWEEYVYLQGMEAAYDSADARKAESVDHFRKIFMTPQLSFLQGLEYKETDYNSGIFPNISCSSSAVRKEAVGFRSPNGTGLPSDMLVTLMLKVRLLSSASSGSSDVDAHPAKITIRMRGEHGYLSAVDWPLLPFYATMCTVYVLYAIAWITFCAMHWKDILQIQYWIGAVIVIGLTEKAFFYAEYSSVNSTGYSIAGAVVAAEIVSALKRALSRMLVIIVAMGFGIVKPRLGQMLPRVFLAGGLYFVLGSVEGCLRGLRPKNDPSGDVLLTLVPLALLDSVICWWIFACLIQTLRALKLRRNVAKTSLYRHFANTLVFAVVASVVFMLWSVRYHRMEKCLQSWKGLWLDEAFWHMLFSGILLVIIVLWRPTKNNRRYAFSPILDRGEDDEEDEDCDGDEEHLLYSAAAEHGMRVRKLSGSKQMSAGDKYRQKDERKKKELESREWDGPNLPPSLAEAAIPTLVDSEEEMTSTRLELSKVD